VGRRDNTVGQVEEFGCGGDVGGDGHVALLRLGDLEEPPSQRVGVVGGASAVCQLGLGRHGGWRGWRGYEGGKYRCSGSVFNGEQRCISKILFAFAGRIDSN